ncbi:MAG: hypothetical protein WDN24_17175 [Sphingomonas sp.]
MTRTIIAAVAGALALSACGEPAPPPDAVENDAADAVRRGQCDRQRCGGRDVLAVVLAMPDAQRNIVFVRAVMDAGLPCEGVVKSERMPDQDGKPLWRAECKNGKSHLISITPDGTANIISRSDR